ncbi:hypothetical protein [Thalassovita aquimarina]|uniref:DUF61 family protein n=1 Tax=Thalassovita aquimarina TaxID=2785917 RepID=A0ABS5HLP7_9RHOB|nr:hypothetical protein [Thalassovita aquimarina]MBR9649900.1 hypothetical protein [Thalassovita aquimarina]
MNTAALSPLDALQALPPVLDGGDGVVVVDVWGRQTLAEQRKRRRSDFERIAFQGMGLDDLLRFLDRAAGDALETWSAESKFLTKMRNRLTVPKPGYAEISGAILIPLLRLMDIEAKDVADPNTKYYLRADVAAEFGAALQEMKDREK